MRKALLAVLLSAAAFASAHAQQGFVGDTLNIQYRSTGPLQIELTGPPALIERARGLSSMPPGGCGYTLEWGDSSVVTPSATAPFCRIDLKHTYEKAGRYVIRSTVAKPDDQNAVNGVLKGELAVILN